MDRFMHPDASEEYFQAQAAKRRATHTATGIESLAAGGNFDEAVAWAKGAAALSPADKRKYFELINGKRAEALVLKQVEGISRACQGGDTEALTAAVSAGYEEIRKSKLPPEVKGVALRNLTSEINVAKTRVDARDNSRLAAIAARAEAEGLTPMQMQSAILADPEMSQAGKTEQVRKIVEGTFNKVTPENRAEADRLLEMINDRIVNKNPMSKGEVLAEAQERGLTMGQTDEVEAYRAGGGLAGVKDFVARAKRAYSGFGAKGDPPPGFYDEVVRNVPGDGKATPKDIEAAVAEIMVKNVEGETADGLDWTYGQADAANRAGTWLPDVSPEEFAQYEPVVFNMRRADIPPGQPVPPVTLDDVREYKRVYVYHLPPLDKEAVKAERLRDFQEMMDTYTWKGIL